MKNNLLKKIAKANRHKRQSTFPKIDYSVFDIPDMPLTDLFKQELEKVGGFTFICNNEDEAVEILKKLFQQHQWTHPFAFAPEIKALLDKAQIPFKDNYEGFNEIDVGINKCEFLAAWTGSVIVSSSQQGARKLNIFSPELIIIARKEQILPDIHYALKNLIENSEILPSQISVITGPSKTADIEKTLIYGMHGPKNLYVIIY